MIKKLLPVMLALLGFVGGAVGGDMLKTGSTAEAAQAETAHAETTAEGADAHATAGHAASKPEKSAHKAAGGHGGEAGAEETGWFSFPQQFFVPVLHDGQLDSTMIMTLSVEMPGGSREVVNSREIKLRDALLRQLLIHANTGGFDGNFTGEAQQRKLRAELVNVAQAVVPDISDVLIGDIARQDR